MVRRSVLQQIYRELRQLRYHLVDIERAIANSKPTPINVSSSDLLLLPDHLRKTYMAAASKGECDATAVSNLTGRCRAMESHYLNQLVQMKWLKKRRESKTVFFRLARVKQGGPDV